MVVSVTPVVAICSANLLSAARARCVTSEIWHNQPMTKDHPHNGATARGRKKAVTFSLSLRAVNLLFSSSSCSFLSFSSFCSFSLCFRAAFWAFFFSAFLDSISSVSGPGTLNTLKQRIYSNEWRSGFVTLGCKDKASVYTMVFKTSENQNLIYTWKKKLFNKPLYTVVWDHLSEKKCNDIN